MEKVVKHLEMIQGVVDRLNRNSFLVKSWSLVFFVVAVVLVAIENWRDDTVVLVFLVPIVGLWILDGYFLWQERLFRQVYEAVRQQSDTDFKMDPGEHKDKPKCGRLSAMFSQTLVIFYVVEIVVGFIYLAL